MIPKRYLYAVELADTKAEVVGTLFEDTINNRELCGEGDADVEAFIRAIDRIGYEGTIGVWKSSPTPTVRARSARR